MSRDHDDDLDLPALDGDTDEVGEAEGVGDDAHEELDFGDEAGDAFDDAAAGDAVDHGMNLGDGPEGGLLVDADDAAGLDVGTFDVSMGEEGGDLLEDRLASESGADDDLALGEEAIVADGGEEGPLADDEELREEDLPALDADDDGDVADDELYDRTMLAEQDELRWDDRAWTKLDAQSQATDDADDSGTFAVPGDEPANRARDAAWKALEETGRITAATILPGGSAIVALATADWGRAQLVRILPDGTARIIAEIDLREEDGDVCKVTHLRWQAADSRLVAVGSFGVCAFRPT